MPTPKVSVIIPVYNVELYIERCARSLFEQTLQEIEYIFINDCTPDDSMQILQKTLEKYPQRKNQVTIINQPHNMGAAKAREDGIKAAQGEYIIHCDSDDWVDKEMYRAMYEKATESRLDCVLCRSTYYTDGSSHKIVKYTFKENKMEFLAELIYGKTSVSLCYRMVKKEIYQIPNFIYPTNHMMEDRVYSIQISYYTQSQGCIDKPFYYYYQRPGSVCGNTSDEGLLHNFHQASANFAIIEQFLREKQLLNKYKDALCYFEFVVRGFLIPLLKKNNKYRRLWMNSFHGGINKIWLSKSIPWTMKVISLYIITGAYPVIYKLLHFKIKLPEQNK